MKLSKAKGILTELRVLNALREFPKHAFLIEDEYY
jgi:hypothetical protein